ncbi:MAG: 1-acyl-sn-glycerol-3-phosphate acyltransferase [Pseudobacteriovorax sp.]|nr:1-acyl-sn-glycerol-3-phosphate acyltransferase [Pseudobacteriovorax sp.]
MRVIRAIYFWVNFWTYTFLLFFKVLWIRFADQRGKSPLSLSIACHEVACRWGKGVIRSTKGWSFEIKGEENLDRTKPTVYVANHQSSVDICALYTLNVQFRWLSKAEVFRIPIIGHAMRWAGYVGIARGSLASHKNALFKSAEWIQNGISMVYFPEGSRSADGSLGEFKSGAFRLAEQESVSVQPIVLQGTGDMMAKDALSTNPAHVTIEVLPREFKREEESVEEFTLRVRDIFSKHLTGMKQKKTAHP